MEVQDGFIVGIFNYCDRWCERCPLTNRCRLFADMAEIDFEQGNGPLTEPRMRRERRRLAAQMIEFYAQAEELGEKAGRKPDECLGLLPQGQRLSSLRSRECNEICNARFRMRGSSFVPVSTSPRR